MVRSAAITLLAALIHRLQVFQGMIGWNQLSIEFIFKILILCIMFVCFNHLGALTFLLIGREYSALIEPYGPGGGWSEPARQSSCAPTMRQPFSAPTMRSPLCNEQRPANPEEKERKRCPVMLTGEERGGGAP